MKFIVIEDFEVEYKPLLGKKRTLKLEKGQCLYSGIDYSMGYNTHIHTKKPGNGGEIVMTKHEALKHPKLTLIS